MEIARLYYLACELSPVLPDGKLLRLLPPKYVELLKSATQNGIASNQANYEQLAAIYEIGAKVGIEPTEKEFRSAMSHMIQRELDKKDDLSLDDRLHCMSRLVNYYKTGTSFITPVRRSFKTKVPPMNFFKTGFEPFDEVLGGGTVTEVTTIVANPGTGKSYISLAIAHAWKHGSVLFYDPENGEALMLSRANQMDEDDSDDKEFIFGHYDPEDILEYVMDNPDPGRLVIMDSLHFVCGTGRTPDSGLKYEKAYQCAVAMKMYAKLIIITTQIKRGADGDSLDAGAASACIERHSGAQLNLSKKERLPDGHYKYRFYCSKNRNGVGGTEIEFAFDYERAQSRYIIRPPVFSEELLATLEDF